MYTSKALVSVGLTLALALPVQGADDPSMPQPVVLEGITYLSGGIGKEEASYMNALVRRYDLVLYFVEQKSGRFLADIDLVIQDRKGDVVFSQMVEGPIFLAKLPPGRYKIVAAESGREQQRHTRVNGKAAVRLVFHWTTPPES